MMRTVPLLFLSFLWATITLVEAQDFHDYEETQTPRSAESLKADTVCHDSPHYRIIARPKPIETGEHFLVKYTTPKSQKPPCDYSVQPGDLEITGEWAASFLGLEGDLLILDSGCCPGPSGLLIWDLKKGKRVYEGSYADAMIHPTYMEFWLETGVATPQNCPQFRAHQAATLGSAIETWVRLDFSTFELTKSSKKRCSSRQ